MRVVAVGLAAALKVEMGVAGGGRAELGIGRVVSTIRALMMILLVRERMRACACFDATKRCLLHQILVVCLHQMAQRLAMR